MFRATISAGHNADHSCHDPGRHDDDDGHGMAPAEMTMTIMAVMTIMSLVLMTVLIRSNESSDKGPGTVDH